MKALAGATLGFVMVVALELLSNPKPTGLLEIGEELEPKLGAIESTWKGAVVGIGFSDTPGINDTICAGLEDGSDEIF